jgi:hypothetical protein
MKEANLLIFRDYSIKIGDFGISIKLRESWVDGEDEYDLKGITPGYVTDIVKTQQANEDKVERKDLLRNDLFALHKTFSKIKLLFNDKIKEDGRFSQLLDQIDKNKPLKNLVKEYA